MRLLIVDNTSEAQAACAKRIEAFNQSDVETLDLRVRLTGEREYAERLREADVLVLGSGLGERATAIARGAKQLVPWIHIILFVTDDAYSGGAFRAAHSVGVRKVLPDSASPLDFLQELVAIHSEFRREGRTREGLVVAVTHAKGGTGATSIAAALAEVCSVYHRRTMLWDLDVETRDLCRALTVNGVEAKVVSAWVNGTRELTRESLKDALIPISSDVSVLLPPDSMAESMDLVCHIDGMGIAQRIIELSRVMHDVIVVDTGGRIGPATGAIIRAADVVLLVMDDSSILGLTAVDIYLTYIKTLVGNVDRIVFAINSSNNLLSIPQIAAELEPAHHLGERPWRLPPIPYDAKGLLWPGSGRTLYSMGQKSTRQVLETIAMELRMVEPEGASAVGSGGFSVKVGEGDVTGQSGAAGGWMDRLFGRGKSKRQDRSEALTANADPRDKH